VQLTTPQRTAITAPCGISKLLAANIKEGGELEAFLKNRYRKPGRINLIFWKSIFGGYGFLDGIHFTRLTGKISTEDK
jgi:hypothetical protein